MISCYNNYRYNYKDIAVQMTKSGVNFFVGGGKKYFNSREDKREYGHSN